MLPLLATDPPLSNSIPLSPEMVPVLVMLPGPSVTRTPDPDRHSTEYLPGNLSGIYHRPTGRGIKLEPTGNYAGFLVVNPAGRKCSKGKVRSDVDLAEIIYGEGPEINEAPIEDLQGTSGKNLQGQVSGSGQWSNSQCSAIDVQFTGGIAAIWSLGPGLRCRATAACSKVICAAPGVTWPIPTSSAPVGIPPGVQFPAFSQLEFRGVQQDLEETKSYLEGSEVLFGRGRLKLPK